MQVTRPNVTHSPGVRLHPGACAAFELEAERATPKHLGTQVPRPRGWHALGTGSSRKSGEPKGGNERKHGGTSSRRNTFLKLAAISPQGVARGRFVGNHMSGLAGCKPPPLFMRGAFSCTSQGQRQEEPLGAPQQ